MSKTRESYYSEKSRDQSYADIVDGLSGQRKTVYDCIVKNGPLSDNAISAITGIRVHIVVARRNELWGKEKDHSTNRYEINPKLQLIEFAGYDETVTPKQSLWRPVKRVIQPSLF